MQRMLGLLRSSSCMMRQNMEWNHCGHLIWLSIKVINANMLINCNMSLHMFNIILSICNKQN